MSIILPTGTRNAACNAIVDLTDVGSTNAQGRIQIKTSGDVVLVTCNMSNPAFGDALVGVATASTITAGTAVADGTAAKFTIIDRNEATVLTGECGLAASGKECILNSLSIATGVSMAISSLTVTQPAS